MWYVSNNGLTRRKFSVDKDGEADWRIDTHNGNHRIIDNIGSLFEAKDFFFSFEDAHRYALNNYNELFEKQEITLPTVTYI